jgi:serine/threonine protein phosphatase 1
MYFDSEVQPGDILAVGDLHARYDLLQAFIERVRGSQAIIIFLGDLIDRGGDDLQVLNEVCRMIGSPEDYGLSNVFCLMGNHEAMFIDALTGPSSSLNLWLQNGGNFEQYDEMRDHLEWLTELPVYMTIGGTMFIHAGIIPSKDPFDSINKGQTDRILWMRSPFLECGPEFEKWNPSLNKIVFGHTPSEDAKPYTIPGGGICIDTGAFYSNVLTAYNDTQNTFYQFTLDEPVSVLPGPVRHSKSEQPERP